MKKHYITDKRYSGVRKKTLGYLKGFGEDYSYFIQYLEAVSKKT